MVRALIVAHGDLAGALVDALTGLAGPQEGLAAVSNRGCGMPEMVERIRNAGDAMGPGRLFVFADLLGGSCAQAARMVLADRPDWSLITGANLPMLVNFFQNRDRLPPAQVLELMVDRARAGVQVFPGPTMAWTLVRLDDRLLHGQVAVGWAGRLRPARIVVADDVVSASELGRELAESSAPPGVEARVVPLEAAASLPDSETENAFLLLRGPRELVRALRAGMSLPRINVGGLHAAPGRRRVLDYLYLDEADAAALRAAAAAGCRLTAQDVPGNPEHDVLTLLLKAGL